NHCRRGGRKFHSTCSVKPRSSAWLPPARWRWSARVAKTAAQVPASARVIAAPARDFRRPAVVLRRWAGVATLALARRRSVVGTGEAITAASCDGVTSRSQSWAGRGRSGYGLQAAATVGAVGLLTTG